jgi:hypothetical protein
LRVWGHPFYVSRLVLAQNDVDTFLAASKQLSGRMRWIPRRTTANVATLGIEIEAIQVGQLIAVQLTAAPRFWKFRLEFHGVRGAELALSAGR